MTRTDKLRYIVLVFVIILSFALGEDTSTEALLGIIAITAMYILIVLSRILTKIKK